MVYELTEEGFLWGVIPAVAPSGHGLPKLVLLEQILKGWACVMAALIRMDEGFFRQFEPLLLNQLFYGIYR